MNKNSLCGRWFKYFFDFYPKNTCQFGHMLLASVILFPFLILPYLGKYTIPSAIRIPENERVPLPRMIKALAAVLATTLIGGSTWAAFISDKNPFIPLLVLIALFWIFSAGLFLLLKTESDEENKSDKSYKSSKVSGFFETLGDTLRAFHQKTCKKIDWD